MMKYEKPMIEIIELNIVRTDLTFGSQGGNENTVTPASDDFT